MDRTPRNRSRARTSNKSSLTISIILFGSLDLIQTARRVLRSHRRIDLVRRLDRVSRAAMVHAYRRGEIDAAITPTVTPARRMLSLPQRWAESPCGRTESF